MNREAVVERSRLIVKREFPEYNCLSPGWCLFWAAATVLSIKTFGQRAIIQAGTCFWPRLTLEQASKEIDPIRRFGYKWELMSNKTLQCIRHNLLPEMHVWAAIPSQNEIVDLTSGEFPEQCMHIINLDWPGNKPPSYFWHKADLDDWPDGVQYLPDSKATELAMMYIDKVFKMQHGYYKCGS